LDVLKAIHRVAKLGGKHVPLMSDDGFRFPAQGAFLRENHALLQKVHDPPEELEAIVLAVFREIAISFQPLMASEAMLKTCANSTYSRLAWARRTTTMRRTLSVEEEDALPRMISVGSSQSRSDATGHSIDEVAVKIGEVDEPMRESTWSASGEDAEAIKAGEAAEPADEADETVGETCSRSVEAEVTIQVDEVGEPEIDSRSADKVGTILSL